GWKLVENYGQHIAKLVAIAPGPPGNIQAMSEIASETADTVVVRGSTMMTINLKQAVVSDRNFVEVKLVGKSTQFPREHVGLYASSLVPIPPRLLYQRRNIRGSQLKVADLSNYRGKRILVMTGTADIDHPRELDGAIVEWLNQNGAKSDFLYLGDKAGVAARSRRCRGGLIIGRFFVNQFRRRRRKRFLLLPMCFLNQVTHEAPTRHQDHCCSRPGQGTARTLCLGQRACRLRTASPGTAPHLHCAVSCQGSHPAGHARHHRTAHTYSGS